MKYNREFQTINNEEKAYFLGLFYADGNIAKVNNTCKIILHENDKYLLDKLQAIFPFFKVNKSHVKAYQLICVDKQLKLDLINLGLCPAKSKENKDVLKFPNIDNDLIHHFIRGYFDGDGSVYKQKLFNIKIDIGSVSFKIITTLIQILYNNKVTVNLTCNYRGTANRAQDFYVLYTSSYRVSKQFADYIYKDATIFMKRKHALLSVIPEYAQKIRLQCPKCNSYSTTYIGYRKENTRIHCKNCNKRSSIKTAPDNSNIISGEDELLES